jgi:hypothetical protein
MVATRQKITNVSLFKKILDIIFFGGDNNFLSQKKNYVPHFLKQRDINSYFAGLVGHSFAMSPFYIFERCLDSNPESCHSKQARYQLSHPSP